MSAADSQAKKRLRGVILKLVAQNHERQKHRLDDVTLTGVLERLHFDVYVDLVRELLQDMGERELLKFVEEHNRQKGGVSIRQIQIRPRGRDIIEGTATDPAVYVE